MAVDLRLDRGSMTGLELVLLHGHHVLARHRIARLTWRKRRFVLRVDKRHLARGTYTVAVRRGHDTLASRVVHVR